jgi:hypothetical protein
LLCRVTRLVQPHFTVHHMTEQAFPTTGAYRHEIRAGRQWLGHGAPCPYMRRMERRWCLSGGCLIIGLLHRGMIYRAPTERGPISGDCGRWHLCLTVVRVSPLVSPGRGVGLRRASGRRAIGAVARGHDEVDQADAGVRQARTYPGFDLVQPAVATPTHLSLCRRWGETSGQARRTSLHAPISYRRASTNSHCHIPIDPH